MGCSDPTNGMNTNQQRKEGNMFRATLIGMMGTLLFTGNGGMEADPGSTYNLYPNTGIVTEIDEETDRVYWNDGANTWYFYGVEDWMERDGIAVMMNDNGTKDDPTDDWMVGNPRYVNWEWLEEVTE